MYQTKASCALTVDDANSKVIQVGCGSREAYGPLDSLERDVNGSSGSAVNNGRFRLPRYPCQSRPGPPSRRKIRGRHGTAALRRAVRNCLLFLLMLRLTWVNRLSFDSRCPTAAMFSSRHLKELSCDLDVVHPILDDLLSSFPRVIFSPGIPVKSVPLVTCVPYPCATRLVSDTSRTRTDN